MVDLRKNEYWQKTKKLPAGKTRNKGWINPSIYRKDLKSGP